jgi:hypothetical protein
MTGGSVARPAGIALFTLVSCCLALVSGPSPARCESAHLPIPLPCQFCTFPPVIPVVGVSAGGVPDALGTFTVIVRDVTGNPVPPGATVTIDLSGCGEINLCPSCCSVSCGPPQVAFAITDLMGRATFDLVGARSTSGPVASPGCAAIWVDGTRVAIRSVAAYDLNGVGGVNSIDLSIAAADCFAGTNLPRSDYDGDGDVDALDLSLFVRVLFGGGSRFGCSTSYCLP